MEKRIFSKETLDKIVMSKIYGGTTDEDCADVNCGCPDDPPTIGDPLNPDCVIINPPGSDSDCLCWHNTDCPVPPEP